MTSQIKFPRQKDDGSFSVVAVFSLKSSSSDLLGRIRDWFTEWVEANRVWVWTYDDGELYRYPFFDEFDSVPTPMYCHENELTVRLDGKSAKSKFWKDWLALKIVPDLTREFSEIQCLLKVVDYDGNE